MVWAGIYPVDTDEYEELRKSMEKLQLNDSALAIQTAVSGNGVALGRTTLVERDLAEGRLVKPFEAVQGCELAYYLVHRKESGQSAPVLAFKEWLLEEAGPR